MSLLISFQFGYPFVMLLGTMLCHRGKMTADFIRHGEGLLIRPSQIFFSQAYLLLPQGFAVGGGFARLVRRAITDGGAADNQARALCFGLSLLDSFSDAVCIQSIDGADNLPAVSLKPAADVFCKSKVGAAFDGNIIVIVEINQLAQP